MLRWFILPAPGVFDCRTLDLVSSVQCEVPKSEICSRYTIIALHDENWGNNTKAFYYSPHVWALIDRVVIKRKAG